MNFPPDIADLKEIARQRAGRHGGPLAREQHKQPEGKELDITLALCGKRLISEAGPELLYRDRGSDVD